MGFDSKYSNHGLLKVDGNIVRVYYSNSNYDNIHCGAPVSSATWAGDTVIVNYANGKTRRYKNTSNYDNV